MFKIIFEFVNGDFYLTLRSKCFDSHASVLSRKSECAEDVAFDARRSHTMRRAFFLSDSNGRLEIAIKI